MSETVALFLTCAVEQVAPEVGRHTVELLEATGARVVFPGGQTCCGQPALAAGQPAVARGVARHWLRTFRDFETIVAPSGSCVAMVQHHYPRLLSGDDAREAARLAARTVELSQFLAPRADSLRLALNASATWHDACHMARSLGERDSPRDLLRKVEGLELREMVEPDVCCGFGGVFSVTLPAISIAMADEKLAQAGATWATYLCSADTGCLTHLAGRRSQAGGGGPEPIHLASLLRKALA